MVFGILVIAASVWYAVKASLGFTPSPASSPAPSPALSPSPAPPASVVFASPPPVFAPPPPHSSSRHQQQIRPDLYPEPVRRLGLALPQFAARGMERAGPYEQVGILTGEGGSSGSAAPDRTILPLYGRELDVRRGKWNYYTRTDGNNPVQVPVRVRNRLCDDDTNGCEEVYNDDAIHVPALGRSFKATVYKKSVFG
jgi:hypothetical protein